MTAHIQIKKEQPHFSLEGGSWTNNISWVQGYDDLLGPMNHLSVDFHKTLDQRPVDKGSKPYRNALFHLLSTQTSCYRYWGQGIWTDYARELCRRTNEILQHNF